MKRLCAKREKLSAIAEEKSCGLAGFGLSYARSSGLAMLTCSLSPQGSRLGPPSSARYAGFVVPHPFHDETVERMGHPWLSAG